MADDRAPRLTRRELGVAAAPAVLRAAAPPRPNILWITCEDTGPELGCYGDTYSTTPNLDRLASRGQIYTRAWSNAPVCAPARTTIISGVYPTATGSEHMRSLAALPAHMRMYPQLLREAGYYASNNSKEDYNLEKPGQVWDDSSTRAHWRNRRPGQPFFSIFNLLITHESQLRTRPHTWVHDPAKARVPAYHPDTREVRQDWAQDYDNIMTMDSQAGRILADLESDGLGEDTIVFFYGDHGSGMPRSKRWPYNSGLQVPLIVSIPEKFRSLGGADYRRGGKSGRMVSFVDLAPTLASLAGLRPPDWMQGSAFLGPYAGPPRRFLCGFRGRMDERCDMVRSIRDERFIYIRNYMPHRIYGQYLDYMFQTPTTRVWRRLHEEGKLSPEQDRFWQTKPEEELYDLDNDRDEVRNLAGSREHRGTLERLRAGLHQWMRTAGDVGFLPEDEIHTRSRGSTPYEVGHDPKRYPIGRVIETAEMAASRGERAVPELRKRLSDPDSAVRYWAATGMLVRGGKAVETVRAELIRAMADPAPAVRVPAAEALAACSEGAERDRALDVLTGLASIEHNSVYIALAALNALDSLGPKAAGVKARVATLPRNRPGLPARTGSEYISRAIEHFVEAK
jgi:arylsulfatase A-like enzyme